MGGHRCAGLRRLAGIRPRRELGHAELARLKILAEDGPEALRALDHAYPADHPLSVPVATAAGPATDRLADDLAAFASAAPSPGGSNNWAIAGARTASGVPLLANDPHLAARLPAPWYLAHLRCPEWEVAGASFVGGPVFPIAHNGHAAWGITAGMTDQADLFIEEIGDDGASVREGSEMVPCQVVDEAIEVRGGDTVTERVLLTRHGPIISPFLDGAPAALSLSAIWLRPMPIRGFLACLRARDFETFRRGFAAWPGPALNVVYADADGHVGYQLVGQLPRRRRGHGTLPLPGWLEDVGWEAELVPFDQMPHLADPEIGFVASANNRPAADGDAPYLGTDWMDGYRMARIVEELAKRHDWDVAGCAALQLDVTSGPWRRVRGMALDCRSRRGWPDGGRHPARLGWAGERRLGGRIGLRAVAGRDGAPRREGQGSSQLALRARLWVRRHRAADHLPLGVGGADGRAAVRAAGGLVRARLAGGGGRWLSSAMRQLRNEHGADPAGWGWGRLRTLHAPPPRR